MIREGDFVVFLVGNVVYNGGVVRLIDNEFLCFPEFAPDSSTTY